MTSQAQPLATYHRSDLARLVRCEPADPVSLNVSAAGLCLAITLDAFVEFLRELSGCGDAVVDEFRAAMANHAEAVAMRAGGPWPAPTPAAWECVEPEGAVTR